MSRPQAPRGPSHGSKQAEKYLAQHPGTPAETLARKFNIAVTTVYRAPWWKNRQQPEAAK